MYHYHLLQSTEYLYQNILIGKQKKIIVISSTVGSNVEMKAPIFGYASSKAALTKTFSLLASFLKKEEIVVRILCPGHVKTDMGGEDANVSIENSVSGMIENIDLTDKSNSGSFVRYNGEVIEF